MLSEQAKALQHCYGTTKGVSVGGGHGGDLGEILANGISSIAHASGCGEGGAVAYEITEGIAYNERASYGASEIP